MCNRTEGIEVASPQAENNGGAPASGAPVVPVSLARTYKRAEFKGGALAPLDVRFCMMINLNSSNDQCCKISVNNVNIVIQQQIHCKLENTYPAASSVVI